MIDLGDFRIESDGRYNWTLQQKGVKGENAKNPGEEYWQTIGHYPLLKQALHKFCEVSLKEEIQGSRYTPLDLLQALEGLETVILLAVEEYPDTE
jgi:hypothetical protein